jgi:hypothetical protein
MMRCCCVTSFLMMAQSAIALSPDAALTPPSPRRLSISYYGAPNSNVSAATASFLRSVGVTEVWVPYLAGAWPVDCCGSHAYAKEGLHGGLISLRQVREERLVQTYGGAGIRTWFFERPVPDFEWTGTAGTIGKAMWNASAEIDEGWAALAANISRVYPEVKALGFAGLVFDNEGYYSGVCKDPGPVSCLWHQSSAFDRTVGGKLVRGAYYRRGKQIGAAIKAAWPEVKVIMAYGFPYPGLQQWVQGHVDAGVDVQVGTEHTYGSGPCSGPYYTGRWYQCAFEVQCGPHNDCAHQLSGVLDLESKQWPPGLVKDRMTAGIGPLALGGYGSPAPQYESRYLAQQLHSALCDDAHGALDVWLWMAGALRPQTLAKINRTASEPGGAHDYTSLLYAYSSHNNNGTDLCRGT